MTVLPNTGFELHAPNSAQKRIFLKLNFSCFLLELNTIYIKKKLNTNYWWGNGFDGSVKD